MFPIIKKMLHVESDHFKDEFGRWVWLRGVNISGSCKLPFYPQIPSQQLEGFFESEKTVSFVNRPFPLDEADEHLKRLKLW